MASKSNAHDGLFKAATPNEIEVETVGDQVTDRISARNWVRERFIEPQSRSVLISSTRYGTPPGDLPHRRKRRDVVLTAMKGLASPDGVHQLLEDDVSRKEIRSAILDAAEAAGAEGSLLIALQGHAAWNDGNVSYQLRNGGDVPMEAIETCLYDPAVMELPAVALVVDLCAGWECADRLNREWIRRRRGRSRVIIATAGFDRDPLDSQCFLSHLLKAATQVATAAGESMLEAAYQAALATWTPLSWQGETLPRIPPAIFSDGGGFRIRIHRPAHPL